MPRLLPIVRNTSDTPPLQASSRLLWILVLLHRTMRARLSKGESEWTPRVVGKPMEVMEVAEEEGEGEMSLLPRGTALWVASCGNIKTCITAAKDLVGLSVCLASFLSPLCLSSHQAPPLRPHPPSSGSGCQHC